MRIVVSTLHLNHRSGSLPWGKLDRAPFPEAGS